MCLQATQAELDRGDRQQRTADLAHERVMKRASSKRYSSSTAKVTPTTGGDDATAGDNATVGDRTDVDSTIAEAQRVGLMKRASRRWRDRAHLGEENRRHVIKGFIL